MYDLYNSTLRLLIFKLLLFIKIMLGKCVCYKTYANKTIQFEEYIRKTVKN